jgi:hypothetical protein
MERSWKFVEDTLARLLAQSPNIASTVPHVSMRFYHRTEHRFHDVRGNQYKPT